MEISFLKIENFLSFDGKKEFSEFGKFNTIVGPNNAGKTNLFRVLQFVADASLNRAYDRSPFYHNGNTNDGFSIEIGIKFEPEEIAALCAFLSCASQYESVNQPNPEPEDFVNFRNIVLTNNKLYHSIFSQNISILIKDEGKINFPPSVQIKITDGTSDLFLLDGGELTLQPNIQTPNHTGITQIITNNLDYKGIISRFKETNSVNENDLTLLQSFDFKWLTSQMQKPENPMKVFVQSFDLINMERQDKSLEFLKQVRNFLSKRNRPVNQLSLQDFISIIYATSLVRIKGLRSEPKAILPSNFASIPFPNVLTGGELSLVLFKLKNSTLFEERNRYLAIQKEFENIMQLSFDVAIHTTFESKEKDKELRIPGSYVNRDISSYGLEFLAVKKESEEVPINEPIIYISNQNYSVPIDYSAAGAFEVLLILVAVVGAEKKVLLLDEPALNLHPSKQIQLRELISKTSLKENQDNQVFVITHSPYLVDSSSLKNTWRIGSVNGNSNIHNVEKALESTRLYEDDETKEKELIIYTEIRSLLFSAGAIFVEGISDRLVISIMDDYLSKKFQNPSLTSFEYTLFDIGGKDSISKFIRLARSFDMKYVCVVDYDALMRCDKGLMLNNKKENVSTIVKYLTLNDSTKNEVSQILSQLQNKDRDNDGNLWYNQDIFTYIGDIAKKQNFFIFTTDLEGQLQSKLTKSDSKPLKAIEQVIKKIENHTIKEDEFIKLFDFITEKLIVKPKP